MTDFKYDTRITTKDDGINYLKHFQDNLLVCMELELSRKINYGPDINKEWKVYNFGYCPVCHEENCWSHMPDNMVYDVHADGGWSEFRIMGSNFTAEEFIKRFPLDTFKKYCYPSRSDGLHNHALIIPNKVPIPLIIPRNLLQLQRQYYLGWAWMFGNYQDTFIRSVCGIFDKIKADGFTAFTKGNAYTSRYNGVHFSQSSFEMKRPPRPYTDIEYWDTHRDGYWIEPLKINGNFDMEIRIPDSTLEIDQLVGMRALTRAQTFIGVELSAIGRIILDEDVMTNSVYPIYDKIVSGFGYDFSGRRLIQPVVFTDSEKEFMKSNAIELFKETAPYLSPLERTYIKGLIENPVRERKIER